MKDDFSSLRREVSESSWDSETSRGSGGGGC